MKCALASVCITVAAALPCIAQESAPVTIGGVTYDRVDPGEPFVEAPPAVQDWLAPTPTPAEQPARMMAFVTADPGDYLPDRRPRVQEHTRRLSAVVTPGQETAVWLGVHALSGLTGLRVSAKSPSSAIRVSVRYMHFWPQRTGWASRQWYMTPELLLPCSDGKRTVPTTRGLLEERPFDLPVGGTAAFWLTIAAPADARPGTYRASVTIGSAEKPDLVLPLRVKVLPVVLRRPTNRQWLVYADPGRWSTMSDDQILAELRDLARHGMTGLVEMPLGTADLSRLTAGEVTFDAAPFLRLAALCRKAGLPGPHVCSPGGIPEQVRGALGVQCDLLTEPWPEAVKAGVEAAARAAVKATDGAEPWYYYGVDEPSGDNTYAIQDYQCWRKGGARTYATFYNLGFLEKASEYLTAPCFVVGLISSEEPARAAREACEKTGAEFWWYGTGSYVNPFPQERYMFHNRYGAGFLFWKTGAKSEATWTFCRPHEDVFNDFDGSQVNGAEPKEQVTAYPHLLKPDDWSTYQGAIPTIAWESLREGVDDYCYLYTLESLIAEAEGSRSDAVREAAGEAKAALERIVEDIPWANPMGGVAFGTDRMQRGRRAVGDLIVKLQDAMGR